jgi:hypothetical protein
MLCWFLSLLSTGVVRFAPLTLGGAMLPETNVWIVLVDTIRTALDGPMTDSSYALMPAETSWPAGGRRHDWFVASAALAGRYAAETE